MQNYDLLIIGNGLTAKALALDAAMKGMRTLRIGGNHAVAGPDPRSYAITPSNIDRLARTGVVLDPINVTRMVLEFGEEFSDAATTLNHNQALLGMVDHVDLETALDTELAQTDFCEHSTNGVTNLAQDTHWVTLNNDEARAPIGVIAEGKHGKLAVNQGFGYRRHDFAQSAIVTKLDVERPTSQTARQLFTKSGPIGVLPAGEHRLSIVWSVDDAQARGLVALDDAAFIAKIDSHIGAQTGAITKVTPRARFALFDAQADRLVKDRLVLIGDAAHVVHPMAGQGLNLGLRDVHQLVDLLAAEHRLGQHLGGANTLVKYTRSRRPDIDRISMLTRGLDGLRQPMTLKIANKLLPALGANERLKLLLIAQIDPDLASQD